MRTDNVSLAGLYSVSQQSQTSAFVMILAGTLLSLLSVFVYNIAPWYVSILLSLSFVLAAVFLFKLEWGVYFLLFLVLIFGNQAGISLNNERHFNTRPIPVFTLFLIISILCLGLKRAARFVGDGSTGNPLKVPLFLLLLYSLITLTWSPDIEYGLVVFTLLLINALLFSFLIPAINNEDVHRNSMWFWLFSGLVTAVLTISSIVLHPEIELREAIAGKIGFYLSWNPKVNIRGYALSHPNFTSLILNTAICVGYGMILTAKKRSHKLFISLCLLLMVFANFLTLSKGGVGSFLIMTYFIIFFSSKPKQQILRNTFLFTAVWLLLLVLALLYLNQIGVPAHTQFTDHGKIYSLTARLVMWEAGLRAMAKQSLTLVGLSIGGYECYAKFPHAHNIFISLFFDFGLAGIAFALSVFYVMVKLIKNTARAIYHQHTYFQKMGLVFVGGLLAIAIHSLIDHFYNKHVIWLFLAFAISTLQLVKTEIRKCGVAA